MTPTQIETIGLGDSMLEQMDREAAALARGGMNVPEARARLSKALEEARAANALQESLKHQLKDTTKLVEEKMAKAYVVESSVLDMMIGAVEKNSAVAKVLRRFRSRMRKPDRDEDLRPQPVAAPEAVK